MKQPSHGPGRPTKYGRPSHAVTVTLPEDVLARLRMLDVDLGRAIVSLVDRLGKGRHQAPAAPAEIASYGNQAVIVVTPARALKRLPGVQLVPAGNGRALIALEHPSSISQLELDMRDAIDRNGISGAERATLVAIADILKQARHTRGLTLKEQSIIVLESRRSRRRT